MRKMLLASIFFSSSLLAAPTKGQHLLVCYNEVDSKKVSITIDGVYPDKFANTATVSISKDIDVAPFRVIIGFSDNAKVEDLKLNFVGTSEQYIKSIKLDLGRSGKLSIASKSVYGSSIMKSSLLEFYHPTNSKVECSYSFTTGTRPISGGN